jgi:hypothetical protein
VRLVASPMAQGTFRFLASVCAGRSAAAGGGPSSRRWIFADSTSSLAGGVGDALVVVVDRDGQRLLASFLPDHVLVEHLLDLGGLLEGSSIAPRNHVHVVGHDIPGTKARTRRRYTRRSRDDAATHPDRSCVLRQKTST